MSIPITLRKTFILPLLAASACASTVPNRQISSQGAMDRRQIVLKEYDAEIERRNAEFAKAPANPHDKTWVKSKLTHMYDIDQYMRAFAMTWKTIGFSDDEQKFMEHGFVRRFYMIDWQNTQDLKSLLKIHGWFKISDWGKQADKQAWLLVQHADHDPQFQNDVLKTLDELYKQNETDPSNYAYLYDRVASSSSDPSKRKPQRYGTQGSCKGPGKWEPLPVENATHLDERRKEVGLGPMQDYIALLNGKCE